MGYGGKFEATSKAFFVPLNFLTRLIASSLFNGLPSLKERLISSVSFGTRAVAIIKFKKSFGIVVGRIYKNKIFLLTFNILRIIFFFFLNVKNIKYRIRIK